MANEITVSASLAHSKSSVADRIWIDPTSITQSGTGSVKGIQNIGTSEEAIKMGDVGTPGWSFFKNLDATNYVEIRAGTGVADMIRINAGEVACFRFAADCTAPYAIADTAAIELQYVIYEA